MKILVADDEPFYLEWLSDWLAPKGIKVDFATNIQEAVDMLLAHEYRVIIVDLNIPLNDHFVIDAAATESIFKEYPGSYIAYIARNSGYRTRQVIIYSVHASDAVQEYADRIRCSYLSKGRPSALKNEIETVLSYSPDDLKG